MDLPPTGRYPGSPGCVECTNAPHPEQLDGSILEAFAKTFVVSLRIGIALPPRFRLEASGRASRNAMDRECRV